MNKIWVDVTMKKSQIEPYENLGRFYRETFKSLLRVQIKWVLVFASKCETFSDNCV